jgi:hypothetical protein
MPTGHPGAQADEAFLQARGQPPGQQRQLLIQGGKTGPVRSGTLYSPVAAARFSPGAGSAGARVAHGAPRSCQTADTPVVPERWPGSPLPPDWPGPHLAASGCAAPPSVRPQPLQSPGTWSMDAASPLLDPSHDLLTQRPPLGFELKLARGMGSLLSQGWLSLAPSPHHQAAVPTPVQKL